MSDEQMIYIGPEEDLTQVRQRLENTQSRRVTLVLPSQTQLRSHVAWKLLRARARELGKEVLIVSSDPQIRSVAQAVKFKVATSYERSSPSEQGRQTSRPGRNAANRGKGVRLPYNKNTAEPRNSAGQRPPRIGRPPASPIAQHQPTPWSPQTVETVQSPGIVHEEEETFTSAPGGHDELHSDMPGARFAENNEYRDRTAPPIYPLSPEQIEEEPDDMLLHDFQKTQEIRQAAREGESRPGTSYVNEEDQPTSPLIQEVSLDEEEETEQRPASTPGPNKDPFLLMDEPQPPRQGEQRGLVSIEDFNTSELPVQDIADLPTDVSVAKVEDLGDQGTIEIEGDEPLSVPPWLEQLDQEEQRSLSESARAYEERRRDGRTSAATPFPKRDTIEGDDDLPPIDERPTQITAKAQRISQPIGQAPSRTPAPKGRNVQQPPADGWSTTSSHPVSARPSATPRPRPAVSRTGTRPPKRTPQRSPRHNRGLYTIGIILILVIVLLGLLAYLTPSADVTIMLPSRDYTHDMTLNVVSRNNAANASGVVVSDTLKREFTKSGNGTATGTTKIGTAPATGTVTFTNNGTHSITIPTGTIVTTSDGKQQFATTADAVAPPKGDKLGNTIPVPVQAQQQGTAGNVDVGTINTIPDNSVSAIAQANRLKPEDIQLQVVNNDATQGGGAGNAATITDKDLNDITTSLHSALQDSINTWVQQQKNVPQGAVESTPSEVVQLVNTPASGQVIANGNTFPAQLKVTLTVIVVRASDLQEATAKTLDDLLRKDHAFAGDMIDQDAQQPLTIQAPNFSKATKTSTTLSLKATGKAIRELDEKQIKQLAAGKSVSDASSALKGLPNVQDVEIKTSPGFIWWVSFTHITVHLLPATTKNPAH